MLILLVDKWHGDVKNLPYLILKLSGVPVLMHGDYSFDRFS